MISKEIKLYPYRVFMLGGHVHQAWVPFDQPYDFWDRICELKSKEQGTVEACYFAANGDVVLLFIDAVNITSIDAIYDSSGYKIIAEHEDKLCRVREGHLKTHTKKKQAKSAGQSVKKRRS